MKKIISLLLSLAMVFTMAGCSGNIVTDTSESTSQESVIVDSSTTVEDDSVTSDDEWNFDDATISENGFFFTKDSVALYIHTYGKLPRNFITKDEARELGWEGGSIEDYAPGYAIGGDVFGNREGLLPEKKGRIYYECDIDTDGYHSRGSRRIVFSNDGLIYYTHDHYETFELLYGEE